ncbi:linear gramicidin synthase subunit D-like [Elysia marginata]|uniref:Linear gramicidin synthase subunit D-like n=1 Tax=Elysia marginata TaxID=1093978 RepID=A0AAV4F6H0_9GAST|nr:linear gramicidin synthase subunit D-like [Elysia marginata]
MLLICCPYLNQGFPGLAVKGMSAALRLEVAKHGIKVTNIQPGDVDTPVRAITHDKKAEEKFGPPKDLELLQAIVIAQAVLYAVTQPKRAVINEVLVSIPEIPF